MTTMFRDDFMTPVGRIVQGDPWDRKPKFIYPELTQPKLDKKGVQVQERFIAVAVEKTNPAWAEFWAKIYAVGMLGYNNVIPQGMNWKWVDGDLPDYAAKEGFAGHNVIMMTTTQETQIVDAQGNQLIERSQLKKGDYVDVMAGVGCDGHGTNPSVYMSPNIIRLIKSGALIRSGPTVAEMGAAPAAPINAIPDTAPPPMAAPPLAGGPAFPQPAPPTPVPSAGTPGMVPPVPPAVTPSPSNVPQAPPVAPSAAIPPPAPVAPPAAPSAPPVPPVATTSPTEPQMTAKAGATTREAYLANGWTDALLIAEGFMIAPHPTFAAGPQ